MKLDVQVLTGQTQKCGGVKPVDGIPNNLSDCCLTSNELCHGGYTLHSRKLIMMPALYETDTLSWIFIVLGHWNKTMGRYVAPLGHTILIMRQPSWLCANHPDHAPTILIMCQPSWSCANHPDYVPTILIMRQPSWSCANHPDYAPTILIMRQPSFVLTL